MHRGFWLLPVFASLAGSPLRAGEMDHQFARTVRPLLAKKCFSCHGPDEKARQSDLRLDSAAGLRAAQKSGVIAPRNPQSSELVSRLLAKGDKRMPPLDSGKELTGAEIEVLRRWIDSGANWRRHWAFETPHSAPPPNSDPSGVSQNGIDRFVLGSLQREGLSMSREADRATLIRRLTLDLNGLPPTPDEVDAFRADRSPLAYQRLVDRLLASPRYGERMAIDWLDAARYADTHGYLFDTQRTMWRWREWVIAAFNANMPFDQFTRKQLAGDLLPNPSLDDQIATGFHRNHIINNEAGAIAAEYLVENVLDRVNTTATVWLGLTLSCCQCHDHKYDPFTQREYYELYAFFNRVPEVGLDGFNKNANPVVFAPTDLDRRELNDLERRSADAQRGFEQLKEQIDRGQREWEDQFRGGDDRSTTPLAAHWEFDKRPDQVPAAGSKPPTVFEGAAASYEEGVFGHAANLNGIAYLNAGDQFALSASDSFSFAAWIRPNSTQGRQSVMSRMRDGESLFRGYALQLVNGLPALFLVNSFPDSLLQVQAKSALPPNQWRHLAVTYDGSGKADGVKLYVDGKLQENGVVIDKLAGPIDGEAPFWIGNGHPGAKFKGRIDDARLFAEVVPPAEIGLLPGLSIDSLLAVERNNRTAEQTRRIRDHFLNKAAPPEWRERHEAVRQLRQQLKKRQAAVPTVMVLAEQQKPRATKVLVRGAFDKPSEQVEAATPTALSGWSQEWPRNRLGLAHWLLDEQHPLTARVAVNRIWQLHFGHGLVRTTEDFGVQGEPPTHPQLLDWLAVELVRSGWDVKALQRMIVTSATYRQSSRMTAELRDRDPTNRLLARGPSSRLPAELIRDQALFVSGLLVDRMGGPSVKPYQPAGLWREVAFDLTGANLTAQIYQQDRGASLYRKSMYTFWKRTAPPPVMLLFDAPDRERCVVRRAQTNTPLQALALMNDPTFIEASRHLAARAIRESGDKSSSRIALMFRAVVARKLHPEEEVLLRKLLQRQTMRFQADPAEADALLAVGDSSRDGSLDKTELAALTIVASVILNLDEAITKR